MSDQNKSNFQALGAGFLGFVAVLTVGGGLMMLHSSRQTQSAAKPAAAPIDLSSSMSLPAATSPSVAPAVRRENRAESPAPLIGDHDSFESVPAPSASAAPSEAAKAAAGQAKAESALNPTEHAKSGGANTAEAVVKNKAEAEKTAAKGAAKKPVPVAKLTDAPGASAVASTVHYGVTDRSELMGRAAGPVYNFKGGGSAKDSSAAAAASQGDLKAKFAGLKKQLQDANLPADQRDSILKQLEAAGESVEPAK
ncbi:MAG: hypothetical protein HY923_08520 [Elusimicrobia bacterium]|nr:hypothetical protein [Elusimicrobiota bacterium]